MKIRLTCTHCRATFLVTDETLGQIVSCPKCGNEARMPRSIAEVAALSTSGPETPSAPRPARPAPDASEPATERETAGETGQPPAPSSGSPGAEPEPTPEPVSSAFSAALIEEEEADDRKARARRRRRRLIPFALGALLTLTVTGVILWPILRRPPETVPADITQPRGPVDPVERTARTFLDALVSQDQETIDRLGTLDDPPAIDSYQDAQRDPSGEETIRGSFAPIATLHERIEEKYEYDEAIDRFQNANPLGAAADFMDEAEQLRDNPEMEDIYADIAGGTADEQLDAAVAFGEMFSQSVQRALPRKELVPTYTQIVEDAEPPLPPDAMALALRFGEEKETWDDLLGRPFHTIKADGPFILDEAEVVALVHDRLGSSGDPPRPLRLTLRRFRLEGIDTGWRVIDARREETETGPEGEPEPFVSPGESDQNGPSGEPFDSPGDVQP